MGGSYGKGLKLLQCPANGVTALQTVLETLEIGGFDEMIPLVAPDVGAEVVIGQSEYIGQQAERISRIIKT